MDAYGPVGCNAWAISNIPPALIFTMRNPNRGGLDASAQESGDGGNDSVTIALACALGGERGCCCWLAEAHAARNGEIAHRT